LRRWLWCGGSLTLAWAAARRVLTQWRPGLAERERLRDLLGCHASHDAATGVLACERLLGGEEREVALLVAPR
jgi:hypothetical protein